MTYNKPEVVKLDRALESIQGLNKAVHNFPDNDPNNTTLAKSIAAYEADE
jgi:hypothetical protein